MILSMHDTNFYSTLKIFCSIKYKLKFIYFIAHVGIMIYILSHFGYKLTYPLYIILL